MICVGAAVLGLSVSTAVASASASPVKEAGSSLAYPLVSIWAAHYDGGTGATAASGGSGLGITDITAGSVDIGASDAPLSVAQYAAEHYSPIEIPWLLSGVGIGYNVPGVKNGLRFTPTIIADIYTGKITTWANKAITKLNPKYKKALSRAGKITPVFRSDGSGTSFAFQNFLYRSARKIWGTPPSTIFAGKVGEGESGNAGVSAEVRTNKGTIGYIEASYLIQQNIHVGQVQNAAGNYEFPNPANIEAAAKSDSTIPAQGTAFTNALGVPIQWPSKKYKTAYPISSYSYAIVNTKPAGPAGMPAIKAFLEWVFSKTGGQRYGGNLAYEPMPAGMLKSAQGLVNSL